MPLTERGREILRRTPGGTLHRAGDAGCEIVRREDLCAGCGRCALGCPTGACSRSDVFDVRQLLDAPPESRRGALGAALRCIMRHEPEGPVEVPPRVTVLRTIAYDADKCLGCGTCARGCPAGAVEALTPRDDARETAESRA